MTMAQFQPNFLGYILKGNKCAQMNGQDPFQSGDIKTSETTSSKNRY